MRPRLLVRSGFLVGLFRRPRLLVRPLMGSGLLRRLSFRLLPSFSCGLHEFLVGSFVGFRKLSNELVVFG
jgi:hypothetical protein